MFEDLRDANKEYAASFALSGMPAEAQRGLALVTCMDTRVEPLSALGLRPGDAKILRNAGGRISHDVLRSLALATATLGVRRIVVMHHTKCALAGRSDSDLRQLLSDQQRAAVTGWPLLSMPQPEAALFQDVDLLRRSSAIPAGIEVEGWRYDVDTGLIDVVVGGSYVYGERWQPSAASTATNGSKMDRAAL